MTVRGSSTKNGPHVKLNRAHRGMNVSYLRGAVEGPDWFVSVKRTTKQWVKYSISNVIFEKHEPQTWVHELLYLIQMNPKNLTYPLGHNPSTINR